MITLQNITQRYPKLDGEGEVTIIKDISLSIQPGITMLLGPSGSGKSTLLRMMGGVRPYGVQTPSEGNVLIGGEPCTDAHDDVVTVFQHYANRKDLTVEQNIGLPFRLKLWRGRISKEEQGERIAWAMDRVGLTHRAKNRPSQLSGGQNQRVALARALVLKPKILLMDEPFGALDPQTRREMQDLLVRLQDEVGATVVFVTHDVEEALVLGDRILVLSTQPANVEKDIDIPDNKHERDTAWLRSPRVHHLEEMILKVLQD